MIPAATAPVTTPECPKHYLTVCVGLPKGVTVEQARDAIRVELQTTPELALQIMIEDSLPMFLGKNSSDHTRIARS